MHLLSSIFIKCPPTLITRLSLSRNPGLTRSSKFQPNTNGDGMTLGCIAIFIRCVYNAPKSYFGNKGPTFNKIR